VPKTALILSSGRTGTQFLAHYLDEGYDTVVALDRICSPLMREFGYGDEPAWRERVAPEAGDD